MERMDEPTAARGTPATATQRAARTRDAVDVYLGEAGREALLTPEDETRLSRCIQDAEATMLTAALDAGVPLTDVVTAAGAVAEGDAEAADVTDPHTDHDPAETARALATVVHLEQSFETMRERLGRRGLDVHARHVLVERLDRNRRRRNEAVQALGMNRDLLWEVVSRVRTALRPLVEANQVVHGAAPRAGVDDEASLLLESEHEARAVLRRAEHAFGRKKSVLLEAHRRLEEADLVARRAKEALVRANLRLVVAFATRWRERGVPFGDLIQEGNVALMRAADRYDHRVGTRFSTYAAWWLRQAMQRAVMNQSSAVRLPVHLHTAKKQAAGVASRLAHSLGREPEAHEIADVLGADVEAVRRAREATATMLSLQTPIDGEDDGRQLLETMSDETFEPADDVALRRTQLLLVRRALGVLTEREQRILALRFGMDGHPPRTLTEIGREFNLTRERIRQIEGNALRKLRRALPEEPPLDDVLVQH
jgi:RNA polymerase primary sigma factor